MLHIVISASLTSWSRVQAVAWVAVLIWSAAAVDPESTRGCVAAGASVSLMSLAWVLRAPRTVADVITLLRAAIVVAVLCAARWLSASEWWLWSLLGLALAGDLLDGAVARRLGASPNGASLDMECDQLSVLVMSWLVVARGGCVHVLLLPAMRYAFVLAAWVASVPANNPKPIKGDNARGRVVCAMVVVALLSALAPATSLAFADVLTGAAVLLLCWSFASDWSYLFARRRAEAGT